MHDDEVVFGPGLNRAYELEDKDAKYPRIIIDPLVKKEFNDLGGVDVVENGVRFLDPFRKRYVEALKGAGTLDGAQVMRVSGTMCKEVSVSLP